MKYDFDGWVTKNDILCTDGRIIRRDAFKNNNKTKVPLVYQHDHDDVSNVLGHMYLENRPEGVYGYAVFNNTQKGQDAKEIVRNGDLDSLSIYANRLKQNGNEVLHGSIKEVSLVISGANEGAKIMNTYIQHDDGSKDVFNDEAIILPYIKFNNQEGDFDMNDEVMHADETTEEITHAEEEKSGKTLKDIVDSMNEDQKKAMYFFISQALASKSEASHSDDEDDDTLTHYDEEENYMKHNAFETDILKADGETLSHADFVNLKRDILAMVDPNNRKRNEITSLKNAILEHAEQDYGIQDIGQLFPYAEGDGKELNTPPSFIDRDQTWVGIFMNGTKHQPFSRIKTSFADITADEARAKGYTKGKKKLEEIFTLAKRAVGPCTIYKKQKLDRDDIVDITDFDVVAWIKGEMRGKLDEEIARAALVGDGRSGASDDKIKEDCIIPIWKDDEDLFVVPAKIELANDVTYEERAEAIEEAIVRARKDYRGSGNLTFFTTEDTLTDMLLRKDGIGHRMYKSVAEVATALRVNRIVTVPVMENQTRTIALEGGGSETRTLLGIAVDLKDYSFGADKGGAVSMFDDFDIDFNQYKYLIETRCSGALTKDKSAIVVESVPATQG